MQVTSTSKQIINWFGNNNQLILSGILVKKLFQPTSMTLFFHKNINRWKFHGRSKEDPALSKGRTQCRELPLCAGSGEGCQWQALPSPVQCEETATRTRDLPVTGGKTLPLAPGPPFLNWIDNKLGKNYESQNGHSCYLLHIKTQWSKGRTSTKH